MLDVATAVAEAKGGMQAEEKAAIDSITAALGSLVRRAIAFSVVFPTGRRAYDCFLDCQSASRGGGLGQGVRLLAGARGEVREEGPRVGAAQRQLQQVAPNETSPFRTGTRSEAEEIYVVVEGAARSTSTGSPRRRRVGRGSRIGPVLRSFEAGPDGLAILAFGEINPANDAEIVMPDA